MAVHRRRCRSATRQAGHLYLVNDDVERALLRKRSPGVYPLKLDSVFPASAQAPPLLRSTKFTSSAAGDAAGTELASAAQEPAGPEATAHTSHT
eukprot:scaffold2750_cov380-Prasinococcus_capsulatus_cf.AAC.6